MKLKFKTVKPGAKAPSYATPGSAGLDLSACIEHDIYLQPGVRFTCPTGVAIELPEGFEAQIRPRSGLASKHGITVLNSPGTIDSDYRGEIKVILINLGDQAHKISNGDRVAQMVISPIINVSLDDESALSQTERGDQGFGSTGI